MRGTNPMSSNDGLDAVHLTTGTTSALASARSQDTMANASLNGSEVISSAPTAPHEPRTPAEPPVTEDPANVVKPHITQPAAPEQDGASAKPEKTDILYRLTTYDYDDVTKPARNFYQAEPWKGIKSGLPGSDSDKVDENIAVLSFGVSADVYDKTNKPGNRPVTWQDQPATFEFGKDATLMAAHEPYLEIWSKRLIDTMEQLMDYYPEKLGKTSYYTCVLDHCFVDIMHFYAELKAYHATYIRSIPPDDRTTRESCEWLKTNDIGDCGDGKIIHIISKQLHFGSLDITKPCDSATAYDIAVLLRLFALMYRTRAVPTLQTLLFESDPAIKYISLWLLYKPGTYVYVKEKDKLGEPYVCVVMSASFQEKSKEKGASLEERTSRAVLRLWSLYSDGSAFLRRPSSIIINRFDGSKLVRDLEVVPCSFYDKFDGGQRRAELRSRGQKYLQLIRETAAYREYNDRRTGYCGKIIVDPASFFQRQLEESGGDAQNGTNRIIEWLETAPSIPPSVREGLLQHITQVQPVADGDGGERFRDITKIDPAKFESYRNIEEVCLLLPQTIQGFALKTKRWMDFDLGKITDKPPTPKPDQLERELVLLNVEDKECLRTVLPKGEKPIGNVSDFIEDKGEGKVFLLHGPPGTGKTLTVECIANDSRRPLLALTAADIGLRAECEARLRRWFTLAAKWDAILLIDEADLFLEQRREGDVDRNSLVTIFLRTMEYYQGVLFLTTNRPGHIDDSFVSRITVPIEYQSLPHGTKKLIIETLVRKFQETDTIKVDMKAREHLIANCTDFNGRQLRNVLQNAVALAEYSQRQQKQQSHLSRVNSFKSVIVDSDDSQDPPLDLITVERHHIFDAIERQKRFIKYVEDLKGKDEFQRARRRGDYHVQGA